MFFVFFIFMFFTIQFARMKLIVDGLIVRDVCFVERQLGLAIASTFFSVPFFRASLFRAFIFHALFFAFICSRLFCFAFMFFACMLFRIHCFHAYLFHVYLLCLRFFVSHVFFDDFGLCVSAAMHLCAYELLCGVPDALLYVIFR